MSFNDNCSELKQSWNHFNFDPNSEQCPQILIPDFAKSILDSWGTNRCVFFQAISCHDYTQSFLFRQTS
ncbi:hypothetical protein BpHYR1_013749 [Brachionus plicatilis]|uniref:Uncharacterized protein n=1 Tax=Brachionus plicatilis TaxID=10195 RepID=A0A3M7PB55_BRAPC|nr:hypothetical protein BpHYR1_013749 [Brachionus plicatilis]